MAVPNVVRPQVKSLGAGRMVSRRQRWIQLKTVADIPYRLCETYGPLLPLLQISPIRLDSIKKMRRTPSCISY